MMDRRYKQKDNIVTRRIAGEVLLVPVQGNLADMQRLYALTGSGEFIWESLDGQYSLGEICNRMVDTFDVDDRQAGTDLELFVQEALERELIVEVVS